MKLLYRGGLNKYDPNGYKTSYFYEYSNTLLNLIKQGKNIGFVTMAKPDGHYDEHIIPQFGNIVDIIGSKTVVDDWKKYDLLFLCGGDTVQLRSKLEKKDFDIYKLKENVVVLGDSAGAMLMSPWLYDTEDRKTLEFHKGIYTETNTIVIVHENNPKYCTPELEESVRNFAKERLLNVLCLKENETKLYDPESRKFVDFDFAELFN